MPSPSLSQDSLFFADCPLLSHLCSLHVLLPAETSALTSGHVNSFQPHVIKCRELIFTEPDIIATPVLGREKKIQIIMQISLFKTGRLQGRLQKMGLTMEKPKRVTPADFQACLTYTLVARVAPLWNKVGDWLVQGRDFVSSTRKIHAVRMELTVNEEELYFSLNAKLARNPPITLEHVGVCPYAVKRFFEDSNELATIAEYAMENNWCTVLPSMKKGQIVSIKKCLPKDGLFHSYKDVKKYWKNMYGYRLPDTDNGMLYYEIYFKMIGQKLFTYPEVCLRSRDLMTFNCPDVDSVLQQFLVDVRTKMPVICGTKLQVGTRPMYVDRNLTSAQQVEGKQECNLTVEKVPDRSQYKPGKPLLPVCAFREWKPSADVRMNSTHVQGIPEYAPQNSQNERQNPSDAKQNSHDSQLIPQIDQKNLNNTEKNQQNARLCPPNMHKNPRNARENLQNVQQNPSNMRQTSGVVLHSPRDTSGNSASLGIKASSPAPRPQNNAPASSLAKARDSQPSDQADIAGLSDTQNCQHGENGVKGSKPAQGCQAKYQEKSHSGIKISSSCVDILAYKGEAQNISSDAKNGASVKIIPVFKVKRKPTPMMRPVEKNDSLRRYAPTFKTLHRQSDVRIVPDPKNGNSDKCSENVAKIQGAYKHPHYSQAKSMARPTEKSIKPVWKTACNDIGFNTAKRSADFSDRVKVVSNVAGKHGLGWVSSAASNEKTPGSKRKPAEDEAEVKVKRPRAKPKIQDGIDIARLASSDQLSKANTATLAAWLKDRGIPCKSKDKKPELIERIMTALNITTSEQ